MTRAADVLLVCSFLCAAGALPVSAQVLVERKPVRLEYRISIDGTQPIGEAQVSFEPVDTPSGRRLRVKSHETLAFPGATPASPKVQIDETVDLVCDKKGVESFDAKVKTGDTERRYQGVRKGIDYQVTSTLGTKSSEKTITAGVQTTNVGMYCGAFLGKDLSNAALFQNFPMLIPTTADHRAGQLVREGSFPMAFGDGVEVSSFVVWVKHVEKKKDKYWFSDDADQILLRKEQASDRGTLVYEILSLNGAPYPPPNAP